MIIDNKLAFQYESNNVTCNGKIFKAGTDECLVIPRHVGGVKTCHLRIAFDIRFRQSQSDRLVLGYKKGGKPPRRWSSLEMKRIIKDSGHGVNATFPSNDVFAFAGVEFESNARSIDIGRDEDDGTGINGGVSFFFP